MSEEGVPEQEPQAEDGATPDLNDAQKVTRRNKRLNAKEELRKRFMARTLSTREGREWAWDLLERCHIYNTSFSSDALVMAFAEGRREVGLYLLTQIPPETMKTMMEESASYG